VRGVREVFSSVATRVFISDGKFPGRRLGGGDRGRTGTAHLPAEFDFSVHGYVLRFAIEKTTISPSSAPTNPRKHCNLRGSRCYCELSVALT
jgi:hypothetical protein